ncbi:MAG: pyridoxamine 5'-phosphate oxidase family protein [Sporolactobacillus sp.]
MSQLFSYLPVLQANPNGVLATRNGEGVSTRYVQFLFAGEGHTVYFCTNVKKSLYEQLCANPHASFCTAAADYQPVVSLRGTVTFSDDPALKARALSDPVIKRTYGTVDNPVLRLFALQIHEFETFSFKEGKQSYQL